MIKLTGMVKRNCLVFLKDKGAVFFSLLAMIIVLMLTGIFLGDMNMESVTDLLKQYGGARDAAMDKENAKHLTQYWTLAGLMVVNSLTVTLTVVGTMVSDKAGNKLKSFYTAPVSKFMIAVSYIISAVLIGFVFCMLTFTGYMFYIHMTGGVLLTVPVIGKVMGYTFLNVILFSVIMYLAALFVKSTNAWSSIAMVVGTLVGFMGAVYVPVGSLTDGVVNVLKCFPILHGASLMRKTMCEDMLAKTFEGMHAEVLSGYRKAMGIDIFMDSKVISDELQILFLLFCGMITLVLIVLAAKKREAV